MSWLILEPRHIDPLLRFLGPREAGCVGFTSQIYDGSRVVLPPRRQGRVLVRETDGMITGAILQLSSGLYFPVLDRSYPGADPDGLQKLSRATPRIYSAMGEKEDVEAFEQSLRREPFQCIDYYLMAQTQPPPEPIPPRVSGSLEVFEASSRDLNRLFDIQKKYEIEEVLLPGNTFQASASRRHLDKTLRDQLVLYAELDGTPIAKVGTNARGIFYDQIGGVFTESHLRSRGVSSYLMTLLLQRIRSAHKNATLFVKKDNGPAIKMYSNLGFTNEGDFRISYFG
jgi:predicted GNAT family acetyltransferase